MLTATSCSCDIMFKILHKINPFGPTSCPETCDVRLIFLLNFFLCPRNYYNNNNSTIQENLLVLPGQMHRNLSYEIVLGTVDGRNEIRRGVNGVVLEYDDKKSDLLSCDEYKEFTISKLDERHLSVELSTNTGLITILDYYSEEDFEISTMTVASGDTNGASWLLGQNIRGEMQHFI